MSITQAILATTGSSSRFSIYSWSNPVSEGDTNYISYEFSGMPYTTYYWTIISANTANGDFSNDTSGNFSFQGTGSGSFSYTTVADVTTEGQEYFYIYIGTSPGASDIWTRTIYLNDTSTPPPFVYDDFTIEWWQNMDVSQSAQYPRIFDVGSHPNESPGVSFEPTYIYVWGGGTGDSVTAGYANKGTWTHWAVERYNGVIKLYRNGTNILGTNYVGAVPLTDITHPLTIGYGSGMAWKGKVAFFHWIKGYAKYQGNFTTPTAPPVAQTGSVLLLSVADDTNKFVDSASSKTSTVTGAPTFSAGSPFFYSETFTAGGYGGQNITPSPFPPNVQIGYKLSDQHGFSSYVINPNYYGNIRVVDSIPTNGDTYTLSQETNPVTVDINIGGGGNIVDVNVSTTPERQAILAVKAGWTWTDNNNGGSGTVSNVEYITISGQETNGYVRLTIGRDWASNYTFTPPATSTNGSLVFDGSSYLTFDASTDWAIDVDGVVTDSLTLNLDANDPNSYPGTGSTWTNLGGGGVGDITLYGSPTYTAGPPSYLEFLATGQYGVGSTPNIINNSQYTKLIWVRLNDTTSDNNLVSSDNGGHYVFMNATNRIYCGHGAWGLTSINPSTASLSANTWYMIAVTFDTTNGMSLYINGQLDHTYNSQLTGPSGDGSTNIGCYAPAGNQLNGRIGRVMCYNKALTAQEVLTNFNATRNRYGV